MGPDIPSASRDALPTSEAVWTFSGNDSSLSLSIRFIYREGPVVAVRGVLLQLTGLSAGLSRFFALAHGAQTAAVACITAAESECAELLKQQEALNRQLEALPKKAEEEDKMLLERMAQLLNSQKRRCRKLWEAGCQAAAAEGPDASHDEATANLLLEEPLTVSLEEATLQRL